MNGYNGNKTFRLVTLAILTVMSLCVVPAVDAEDSMNIDSAEAPKRAVLIGASIGKGWDLPGLPMRAGISDYEFESHAVYVFDKTDMLRAVLARVEDKPALVIIKECAVYFPGDTLAQKTLVMSWVEMCREEDVQIMLATTVPVVRSFPLRIFLLSLLRLKLKWPGEKFDSILEYNDWIREYAAREGIPILDLEAALSSGPDNRYLRSRFAKVDGLHINDKAYEKLDTFLLQTLSGMQSDGR